MIKISIIILLYNQGKNMNFLRCMESIFKQRFQEYEIILINDGSTDETAGVCDAYANLVEQISVIHREKRHSGAARNTGINQARGEYITFIECDDFIHEEMLGLLYQEIEQKSASVALCDFTPIEEGVQIKGSWMSESLKDYKVSDLLGKAALPSIYDFERTYTVPWSKLYKKKLLLKFPYPENVGDEDEFIAHKLLYASEKVVHIHAPLYFYVIAIGRKGSWTPIPMALENFDKIHALYERAIFFKKNKLKELEEKALLHFAEHFFWLYLQSQRQLPGAVEKRKEIRRRYNKLFIRIIRSKQLSMKERLVYGAFRIHPTVHRQLLSQVNRKKLVNQL